MEIRTLTEAFEQLGLLHEEAVSIDDRLTKHFRWGQKGYKKWLENRREEILAEMYEINEHLEDFEDDTDGDLNSLWYMAPDQTHTDVSITATPAITDSTPAKTKQPLRNVFTAIVCFFLANNGSAAALEAFASNWKGSDFGNIFMIIVIGLVGLMLLAVVILRMVGTGGSGTSKAVIWGLTLGSIVGILRVGGLLLLGLLGGFQM